MVTGEKAGVVRAKVVHGGVRPGAGRKPQGHVRMWMTVPPSVKAKMEARAKRSGKSVSALFVEMLKHTA